ncbi:hypothetical protein BJ322DRAFT_1109491 [Thelephora terrestris]|uniref:SUI1 domain-containing protein n=1 Tax=Thelephora terrestris TaxID=56493 RepID=A0A9P6L6T0_9AGAM|nr:hypothetical protein BJ322DRAFT_1109491 [Thelephora terrestris]
MFKKPLAEFKTSAPLRTSDRKKLRLKVIQEFSLSPEVGELLIPEGLLSVKYTSHSRIPGVAYISSDGVPLWFTTGKGSDYLIPTLYTLWKHADLLPFLSTPSPVISVLINGADLMAPGVAQHSPSLSVGQLVCVTQYHPPANGVPQIGPALAVGRMILAGDQIRRVEKGKAVNVIHTWKDHLWEMGGKEDPPALRAIEINQENDLGADDEAHSNDIQTTSTSPGEGSSQTLGDPLSVVPPKEEINPLSQQEVSEILRSALLQSISTALSKLPSSSFPITPSIFYETYILPYRPFKELTETSTPVDIKHSGHKSLTAFLKASAREGLIRLKESKGELVVTGVDPSHQVVGEHASHVTVKEVEEKKQRKEQRERQEEQKAKEKGRELQISLLWKPHMGNVAFFKEAGKDSGDLFTQVEIKSIVNGYVTAKQILNQQNQAYVNVTEDSILLDALSDLKAGERKQLQEAVSLRRDQVIDRIIGNMQPWHEINGEGREPVLRQAKVHLSLPTVLHRFPLRKGELKPIYVIAKTRKGRAATCITGFENFQIKAEDLAEDLRKACASSTSVNPLPGKAAGQEVMIQGKQLKAATDILLAKGIPKQWIEATDISTGKK